MAAAEARAAWQRAANRCVVQEDRKRAPKLACCPLSSEQQQKHGTNNGNCKTSEDRHISNFVPLSSNPTNFDPPRDIRWWLHLQPNLGIQKDLASDQRYLLGREINDKEAKDSVPESKHEEPLLCEYLNPENNEDAFGPPWMISTDFGKNDSGIGSEELKTIDSYFQVPLKCRGNLSVSDCLCENKKILDFKSSGPPPSKNPVKANFDTDTSWKEGEKAHPWWQITDENELASLVAERAMQNIENCDLPRPSQTVRVHGTESYKQENMGEYAGSSSPIIRGSHSYPGQSKNIQSSYSSTDELHLSNDGVWQHHERSNAHRSGHPESESKQKCPNPSERAQLLEALRHSQTRAREAEMSAKEMYNEKDDAVQLLLRQASHLFACKQWLKILQLENICLQLKHKHKGHQIATLIRELPWLAVNEKSEPNQERKDWTKRKGKRQTKGGGFHDAILFAFGLGLAGAGLLLGWTLGWLLPML
ncbi:unnamed protein product [Alopecurus aequalis]